MTAEPMTSEPRSPGPGRCAWSWAPLLVVLAAILVHSHAVRDGLYEPDEWTVLNLGRTFAHAPVDAADGIEAPDALRFTYRRVLELPLFTALYHLFGYEARAFRALNLLLHAAAAVLVLLLARRKLGREDLAIFAALLFAVHPKSWELAAVASATPWALATVLLLGSLLLFAIHRESCWPRLALAASVLLLLPALFLRGGFAILLPAMLALELGSRIGFRFWRQRAEYSRLLPHLVMAGAAAVVFFQNELHKMATGMPPADLEVLSQPGQILWALVLALPSSLLSLVDPTRLSGWALIGLVWIVLAVLVLLAAVVTRRLLRRAGGFGLGFLVLAMLPMLLAAEALGQGQARYYHLASAGLCLVLASALPVLDRRRRAQRLVAAVLLLVPALATVISQREHFTRQAPARALAESVAALARDLPRGSRLLILEGGPVDRDALDSAVLAAWLARPAGGLELAVVEQPRICPTRRAAQPAPDMAATTAVLWWGGRYASTDLATAVHLLRGLGCAPLPDLPTDSVVADLTVAAGRLFLVGRLVRYESFYQYVLTD